MKSAALFSVLSIFSVLAANSAHAIETSLDQGMVARDWVEAEKTLPPILVKAIDQTIIVLESAIKNLEKQIAQKEAAGKNTSALEEKLDFAESVLEALDSAPIVYQADNSGLCEATTVMGNGRFFPSAVQFKGFITVCPTALRYKNMRSLVSLLLHEVVHQADEQSGYIYSYSDDPKSVRDYECSTDRRSLELYRLGTGTAGERGYNCH